MINSQEVTLFPWKFELIDKSDNDGDNPVDSVIGVAVTGSDLSVFCDWQNETNYLNNLVVGRRSQEMMIAERRIVETIPCFAEAKWIVRTLEY